MMIFKKATLTFTVLSFASIGSAQTRDSIPQKVMASIADKFPQARDFNIEYTHLSPYTYSSELHGAGLPENKVESFDQLKASVNANFIKKKKWLLGTTLNYRYTSINTENPVSILSAENHDKGNFHYHSEALNFIYFSKLWNKMTIYSATVSVDGSNRHFERVRGMLTGTIVLKANMQTKISLGLAAIMDPGSQIPALPIFAYEHKFINGWIVDVILPKKAMIKKDVLANGRIAVGAEMDNTSFYLYHLDKTYEFRQLEITPGAIYEHKFGAFIGTLKTGVKIVPSARIFDKNESYNDYIFDAKPKPPFYFNLGISCNPFGKAGKK